MAFVTLVKALLLLQLLFFVGSFAAEFDDELISPSASAPTPASAPIRSPIGPFEKSVVVKGRVISRSCIHWGFEPVSGATIQMQCNITDTPSYYKAQTNQRGLFSLQGPTANFFEAHKCKVSLGPCPSDSCSKPSSLRGGASGVFLTRPRIFKSLFLFNVGPWAYEPNCS